MSVISLLLLSYWLIIEVTDENATSLIASSSAPPMETSGTNCGVLRRVLCPCELHQESFIQYTAYLFPKTLILILQFWLFYWLGRILCVYFKVKANTKSRSLNSSLTAVFLFMLHLCYPTQYHIIATSARWYDRSHTPCVQIIFQIILQVSIKDFIKAEQL